MRLLSYVLPLLLLCGCAMPIRRGSSYRKVWLYQGRPDGLIAKEVMRDREGGGGIFLLTDPKVASIAAKHTNQAALGGGSVITTGQMEITVDPQTGAIISAGGTAIGNIIGAAAKTAIGKP
jgi:hypothetical protein